MGQKMITNKYKVPKGEEGKNITYKKISFSKFL
jgi:hypothetical protein